MEKPNRPEKPKMTLTGVIAILGLLISLWALYYTMRTYAVTHRPYIGIIEQTYRIGNPPTEMFFGFVMQNTGSLPAWVTVEGNRATLTTGGKKASLPLIGEPGGGIYLLPGQKAGLPASFSDDLGLGKVSDVLTGKTILELNLKLSYEVKGPFWFKTRYHYTALYRFQSDYPPQPTFIMVSGDAD